MPCDHQIRLSLRTGRTRFPADGPCLLELQITRTDARRLSSYAPTSQHVLEAVAPSMTTFPLQDQPIILPSGRIVRIFNLDFLIQRDDPSSFLRVEPSFRIQYGAEIGPDQPGERSAEAAEVVAYFLGEAVADHTTVAYAEICSTRAQAERREPPEASFRFCRGENAPWRLVERGGWTD
jgi:hypothetical protein